MDEGYPEYLAGQIIAAAADRWRNDPHPNAATIDTPISLDIDQKRNYLQLIALAHATDISLLQDGTLDLVWKWVEVKALSDFQIDLAAKAQAYYARAIGKVELKKMDSQDPHRSFVEGTAGGETELEKQLKQIQHAKDTGGNLPTTSKKPYNPMTR